MHPVNARVLHHWRDSADALPVGKPHVSTHAPVQVDLGIPPGSELARMRSHPDLYFEWQLEQAFAARERELQQLGLYEWDCGTCGKWVTTPTLDDPCPACTAPGYQPSKHKRIRIRTRTRSTPVHTVPTDEDVLALVAHVIGLLGT